MTALVTGGASGIGREVAERLRNAGHDVVVWDLADADIVCDVSDPEAVSAAIDQTVREHGVPTRVVTSAGIGASGPTGLLLKQAPADWERVLAVNLTGTWLTLRAAAQAMVNAEVEGSIVAVSSISGTVVDRDMGAYCVSKAGVDMLVKVAAVEWGTYGIRVNAVGPGVTRTPMLPNTEALGWADGLSRRTPLGRTGGGHRRGRRHPRCPGAALGDRAGGARRRRPGPAQPDRRVRSAGEAHGPQETGSGREKPKSLAIPKSMMPRRILPFSRSS